jgi:hypothetical protein
MPACRRWPLKGPFFVIEQVERAGKSTASRRAASAGSQGFAVDRLTVVPHQVQVEWHQAFSRFE